MLFFADFLSAVKIMLFVFQQISSLEGDGALQLTLIEDKHLILSSGSQIIVLVFYCLYKVQRFSPRNSLPYGCTLHAYSIANHWKQLLDAFKRLKKSTNVSPIVYLLFNCLS